jgi:prepilin-type N-terminal cleavage/methylation domain-containing protein
MKRRQSGSSGIVGAARSPGWWPGFTLIELLVVVAMMAIVSAILLPVLLQAVDAARKNKARQNVELMQPTRADDAPIRIHGSLPILDSVNLKMALASSYHRIGMDVFTRFQVDCGGRIVFRGPEGADVDRVALFIPFPANTLEARDVQLTIRRPGSDTPIPLTDVAYTRRGISCTCSVASGEALTADVRFTALGREQFDYTLPPARQLRAVSIVLSLSGTEAYTTPDDSLQPSASGPNQIRWEFKNLVSDRRITVLIPGAEAPLARVLLLLRLVALGVLLFGAGFWYLSEQSAPGRLDTFRLGHFLLLALTYSLFFGIFAVLGFHGKLSTPVSMCVSAVCSLPLLIFHVSRVLDFRFALTRVAPLALFTIGLVVNGVYGGELRDYVFLAAVILCLAYVTLTYPTWAAGRERYRQSAQAAYGARRQAIRERVTVALHRAMADLDGSEARATDYLRGTGTADPAARARLERAREPVKELAEEYEGLVKSLASLPTDRGVGTTAACTEMDGKIDAFQDRLAKCLANLQSELSGFMAARQPTTAPAASLATGQIHCLACGHSIPDAPFCPQCGTAQPRVLTCVGCGDRIVVPIHLLTAERDATPLFCPRCGVALPDRPSPVP